MKSAKRQITFSPLAGAGLVWLGLVLAAHGQVTVDTLGGGPRQGSLSPAGNTDGNTFSDSQFNGPRALALNSEGSLFLADRDNGKVRKVTKPGDATLSQTTTFLSGLNQPVGVAVDGGDSLYVLTQGDGTLRRYDRYGTLLGTLSSALAGASALTMDAGTNFYVALPGAGTNGGAVKKVTLGGVVTTLATQLNQPQGIAMMNNGLLAVSDTGNHAVRLIHPQTGTNVLVIGGPSAGLAEGPAAAARFNTPSGVASSPSGMLVVADRFNHRVRLISVEGVVSTLYGIDTNLWGPSAPPVSYAGWYDGAASIAEAREPVSAVVSPLGTVYTTELYYHLLRSAVGAPLGTGGSSGTNGGATNLVVVPPPTFSPLAGYFPMGQAMTVQSAYPVYYTTDGTEPTTNSLQVALTNGNSGVFLWDQPLRDLTALRLKAISGTNASETVSGQAVPANQLGFSRDVQAGSGSTVVIPIVLNLRPNDVVRTIQYRVEIVPQGNALAVLPEFTTLSISSNDFLQVAGASLPGTVAAYTAVPYPLANPTNLMDMIPGGLAISVIGTNANFYVQNFGVVAMLKVPLPPLAQEGDSYTMSVSEVSATADGQRIEVPVQAMAARTLTIRNVSYVVGDSASCQWYGAGDFGDGDLRNSDVNSVFYASLGVRAPFNYTDVFDAMDAYPPDQPGMVGGDGEIRYLDWQLVLQRSLRLDTNNYQRRWAVGGYRVAETTALGARARKSVSPAAAPGSVWVRQAKVFSRTVTNAYAGSVYYLPVCVNVAAGSSLAGLMLRAAVLPDGDAPPATSVTFVPATGKPTPSAAAGLSANEILLGWSIVSGSGFSPALQGASNLVGYIGVSVPLSARPGDSYSLRMLSVDGAPNLTTQYNLESVPVQLWVRSAAGRPASQVSDEWKQHFFGSAAAPEADDANDHDGDGMSNLQEYLAGTDPTDGKSCLRFLKTGWTEAPVRGVVLNWLSAPGKTYAIERSDHLPAGTWSPVASGLVGDGYPASCVDTNTPGTSRFYRLRLQP
jgi:sugar lactone lactonase YvrE